MRPMHPRRLVLLACLLATGCGPGGWPTATYLDYLRADHHTRLVIEVDVVPGYAPRAATARDLVDDLRPLLDKPAGIEVVVDGTLPAGASDHAWRFVDLSDLARRTFDLKVPRDTVKMHAIVVDGHAEGDAPGNATLGLAWGPSEFAIFGETLAHACDVAGSAETREGVCAASEHWVWLHEIGHLLGLVNLGAPMVEDHEDPDHPGHDINPDCVMYWAAHQTAVVTRMTRLVLQGTTPAIGFDAACKEDLREAREGLSVP